MGKLEDSKNLILVQVKAAWWIQHLVGEPSAPGRAHSRGAIAPSRAQSLTAAGTSCEH